MAQRKQKIPDPTRLTMSSSSSLGTIRFFRIGSRPKMLVSPTVVPVDLRAIVAGPHPSVAEWSMSLCSVSPELDAGLVVMERLQGIATRGPGPRAS